MGIETLKAIEDDPELALVGQTDLGDDLESAIRQTEADAVVDFTTASVAFSNCKTIIQASSRPVIGTSGLLPEQVKELQDLARQKNIGGIIAPNFAIGAVLMMKFASEAARFMPDVEIIELHHEKKADAPSGTAIKTAALIAGKRNPYRCPRCKGQRGSGSFSPTPRKSCSSGSDFRRKKSNPHYPSRFHPQGFLHAGSLPGL